MEDLLPLPVVHYRAANALDVGCPIVVVGTDLSQASRLFQHPPKCSNQFIGRAWRVALQECGADGRSVLVAQAAPATVSKCIPWASPSTCSSSPSRPAIVVRRDLLLRLAGYTVTGFWQRCVVHKIRGLERVFCYHNPTPFEWGGKRPARRSRPRQRVQTNRNDTALTHVVVSVYAWLLSTLISLAP
jgi:hypothetical protein